MNSLGPRIPTELVDLIISDALGCISVVKNPSILSSYALVGRLWRNRINARRYYGLHIYLGGHTTSQIQALADICTSKVWSVHESVARQVQHCTLTRGSKDANGVDLFDRSEIREAAIVIVLRNIFRDKTRRGNGVTAGLRLEVGRICAGGGYGFHFGMLGPNIIAALEDLARTADIENLALERVWGVPWTLLSSATLSYLSLDEVKFLRPRTAGNEGVLLPEMCLLPQLDEIFLNDSPSFIEGFTSQIYRGPPPPVTTMRIAYGTGNQEEAFHDALENLGSKLDCLDITITGGFYELCRPIDYRKVHVLHNLALDLEVNIDHDKRAVGNPVTLPAFENAVLLLPSTPPRELYIAFAVSIFFFDPPDSPRRCIEDIYERTYHPSFPDYLQRITSDAHETCIKILLFVSVHVDPELVYGSPETCTEHEEYLRQQFACIDRMDSVAFEVSVERFDDLPDFRKDV
ncbi:hypothetical protein HYPSUDRAFT_72778 [Hypholoma sublateritium FD-334 SS-4]|uniref:F-box domain-containing protein n=1 Tax=Hypholoma sublateritium (strain FD-334 SS-4) TaxID=945553 RepID=A0A0D2LT16_HYPSF|nr:hypothetical protein HYPSUDRAFT_72778 [Hypholoma sublateritium FD-334 SS-4]